MGTQLEPACYMSHMQVCYTFQPQVSEQKFYKSSISSQRDLCTLLLLLFDVCVCSHTSTVECWALRQLSTVKTDSGLGHWCLEFHMWGMSFHACANDWIWHPGVAIACRRNVAEKCCLWVCLFGPGKRCRHCTVLEGSHINVSQLFCGAHQWCFSRGHTEIRI